MNPINVFWYANERITDSCAAQLNEMLDSYPTKHYVKGAERPIAGAVIVFHGEHTLPMEVDRLNRWASEVPWVIFVSVGDEYCNFPYSQLSHPNMRLWCQTPKPGKVTASRYLIEGYPHDCKTHLHNAGYQHRNFDWMFAGQVNHVRRETLAATLRNYNGAHMLMETKSFSSGLPHDLYYKMMKQAKVVPCPSGLATPDSFRFAEALEAGCIPVLDACSLDGVTGYWDMVLGQHPFEVVEDWTTFPAVCASLLRPDILKHYQKVCRVWWESYKALFGQWLAQDLVILGATNELEMARNSEQ